MRSLDRTLAVAVTMVLPPQGHEDLRQDERVMQLFGLINQLLANDRQVGCVACIGARVKSFMWGETYVVCFVYRVRYTRRNVSTTRLCAYHQHRTAFFRPCSES